MVGRRIDRGGRVAVTEDLELVHHSRCGGRPDAPRDGLQEKRKGRHRAPKLSETRVHSFVGPFGTTLTWV